MDISRAKANAAETPRWPFFFFLFRRLFPRRALGGFAGARAAAQRVQRRGEVETAHGVVEAHTGQTHVHFAEIRVFVQHVQHRRTFLFVKKNVSFLTVSFASRVGVVLVAARVEKRRQERRGASVETRTQGQAHHAERELTLRNTRVRSRVRSFSRSGSFWKLLRRSTAALGESSARERAAGAGLAGFPSGAGVVRGSVAVGAFCAAARVNTAASPTVAVTSRDTAMCASSSYENRSSSSSGNGLVRLLRRVVGFVGFAASPNASARRDMSAAAARTPSQSSSFGFSPLFLLSHSRPGRIASVALATSISIALVSVLSRSPSAQRGSREASGTRNASDAFCDASCGASRKRVDRFRSPRRLRRGSRRAPDVGAS